MRRFLGLTLAALAAVLLAAVPAQATFPGKNGKLSFGAPIPTDENVFDTYTLNSDWTGLTKLIPNGGSARWSPDGTRIAFRSPDYENCCHWESELYVMDADGSSARQLTDFNRTYPHHFAHIGGRSEIEWSPDGTSIAFGVEIFSNTGGGLYTVSANGSGLRLVSARGFAPTWSPDGNRIAFNDGENDIFIENRDGSDLRRLTSGGWPEWSPDGSTILLQRRGFTNPPSPDDGLYTIRPDGTGERKIASTGGGGVWSPDGTKILTPEGILRADGSLLVPRLGDFATWSPDSTKVAFIQGYDDPPDGSYKHTDIYVVNADGTGTINVTNRRDRYLGLDWQPIPAPKRSDYKNANEFCKAEQAFWGYQFSQHYRNFGQCVSGN
jgi:dipeptidyl aminopeptidase/acylaminoacyl peptidase